MVSNLAMSLSVLAALLTGTAWAEESVPTTTDEAREAAGRANYRVAFVEPRPAVSANEAWLTTTDGVRAAFARAQDQHTVTPRPTPPIEQPILIPPRPMKRAVAGRRAF